MAFRYGPDPPSTAGALIQRWITLSSGPDPPFTAGALIQRWIAPSSGPDPPPPLVPAIPRATVALGRRGLEGSALVTETGTPRNSRQRVRDALERLCGDRDLWIATAGDGRPWLVPLSFHWTGSALLMATLRRSPTYRNLARGGGARIALGDTRDVVLLDGDVDLPQDLPKSEAEAVAAAAGYDPRTQPETGYIRFVPRRVQAWRTAAEIDGRTIMRAGRWVAEV
jgi:hypothetical protein